MREMRKIRRMAADILNCGENRIWIDSSRLEQVIGVISREEVKRLIKDGVIRKRPEKGISRYRIRLKKLKKKKGRRRGPGSRKGPRYDEKELWVRRVRAQRRFIRMLKERKIIDRRTYRRLYLLIKGGVFRDVAHIKNYIKEHKLARRI